jgi:hypothetical protein
VVWRHLAWQPPSIGSEPVLEALLSGEACTPRELDTCMRQAIAFQQALRASPSM